MNVTDMYMLRWINGGTREDRIRTDCIRGSIEVVFVWVVGAYFKKE